MGQLFSNLFIQARYNRGQFINNAHLCMLIAVQLEHARRSRQRFTRNPHKPTQRRFSHLIQRQFSRIKLSLSRPHKRQHSAHLEQRRNLTARVCSLALFLVFLRLARALALHRAIHRLAIVLRRHLYRQNVQQAQHQALMVHVFSLDLHFPVLIAVQALAIVQALVARPLAMVAGRALVARQQIAQQGQRLSLTGPVCKAARHLLEAAANIVTLTQAGMLNSLRVTRRLHPLPHMAMDQVAAMARQIISLSASNLTA